MIEQRMSKVTYVATITSLKDHEFASATTTSAATMCPWHRIKIFVMVGIANLSKAAKFLQVGVGW